MPAKNYCFCLVVLAIASIYPCTASGLQIPNNDTGQKPILFQLELENHKFQNSQDESVIDLSLPPQSAGLSNVFQPDLEQKHSELQPVFGLRRIPDIPISISVIWMPSGDSEFLSVDTSIKFPILWGFGTPPPIVKTGFVYTSLESSPSFGLPVNLNEYTIGVSKVYRVNDRWTIRSMLGVALATDDQNVSSDAWQFRGGIFGIYQYNENWQWTVGAIALGRDDLPVVPALGAVWTPNPRIRWGLDSSKPSTEFSTVRGHIQRALDLFGIWV